MKFCEKVQIKHSRTDRSGEHSKIDWFSFVEERSYIFLQQNLEYWWTLILPILWYTVNAAKHSKELNIGSTNEYTTYVRPNTVSNLLFVKYM